MAKKDNKFQCQKLDKMKKFMQNKFKRQSGKKKNMNSFNRDNFMNQERGEYKQMNHKICKRSPSQ